MRRRFKDYEPGNKLSVYIVKDISKEALKWLNEQREVGPAILELIEKFVVGELIDVADIGKYVSAARMLIDNNDINKTLVNNTANSLNPIKENIYEHKEQITSGRVDVIEEKNIVDDKSLLANDGRRIDMSANPKELIIEDENPFEDMKRTREVTNINNTENDIPSCFED